MAARLFAEEPGYAGKSVGCFIRSVFEPSAELQDARLGSRPGAVAFAEPVKLSRFRQLQVNLTRKCFKGCRPGFSSEQRFEIYLRNSPSHPHDLGRQSCLRRQAPTVLINPQEHMISATIATRDLSRTKSSSPKFFRNTRAAHPRQKFLTAREAME